MAQSINRDFIATMQNFSLPAAAIAVIDSGRIVYRNASGVLDAGRSDTAREDTLFKVGSISKSFTALAIGLLVDDGKLGWDDRLAHHIPELDRSNPLVANLTIRQILSHTTRLNLDALEPLLWPQPNDFTFENIVTGLDVLGARVASNEHFRYSNLNYTLAGEIVRRASGLAYGEFVDRRIFKPLDMNCATGGWIGGARATLAQPHLLRNGVAQVIRRDEATVSEGLDASAGGIRCDIRAMAIWLQFQLNPRGTKLRVSDAVWRALRSGVAVTRTKFDERSRPVETEIYGLGIQLVADKDAFRFDHYGGVAGMMAYFAIYPSKNAGFAILMNASDAAARRQLIERLHRRTQRLPLPSAPKKAPSVTAATAPAPMQPPTPLDDNAARELFGRFEDKWFGEIRLCGSAQRAEFTSQRSPRFKGQVLRVALGRTAVFWHDPAIDSDAIIRITESRDGVVQRFVLDPLGHSDFDFSAMSFKRVGDC